MGITFNQADRKWRFGQKVQLRQFLKKLVESEGCMLASLDYVFCSDEYLLGINQQFLQHDTYTDIITFDWRSQPGPDVPIEGEIYISLDRVAANAATYGVAEEQEALRVVFHGLLHLCGYKDKTAAQKTRMRAAEEKYLALYQQ